MLADYVTDDYVARIRAFLSANRVQFVDDDDLARRHYVNTLPWVDPRSLLFAPSVDVEDVYRDGLLLKLAGLEPSVDNVRRVHDAYMRAKLSHDRFLVVFLKEVKR